MSAVQGDWDWPQRTGTLPVSATFCRPHPALNCFGILTCFSCQRGAIAAADLCVLTRRFTLHIRIFCPDVIYAYVADCQSLCLSQLWFVT